MKNLALPCLVAVALLVTGCGPAGTVSPGDGPASSKPGPKKTAAKPQVPKVATFKDKYTYPDGVQLEVTRIQRAKMSQFAILSTGKAKKGAHYVILTVRARNSSKAMLEAVGTGKMSYGPDGDEAPGVFDGDVGSDNLSGKILPGKAKSGRFGYAVPEKYENDATLEFNIDFTHESAVFSGSLT